MNLTLHELKQRLAAKYDPDDLLELLNISSEQLVDVLEDFIIDKQDELTAELEGDDEFFPEEWQEDK